MLKPALATASGTKSGTVESPIVLDHACDHISNLLSRACSTSGACSNVTNHALDASLDTCADLGADSTKWTTQNGSSKGSRLGLRAKASVEGRHKACCEGVLVQFPQGKNHHISYPSVYTVNATYLGTIAQPKTSFISKQSYVANPQLAREVLVRTVENSPPYPSTSVSWTKSDTESTRMLHSSTMELGVLLKSLSAKQNKCVSCS